MALTYVIYLLIFIAGIIVSAQDLRNQRVSLWLLILFLCFSIAYFVFNDDQFNWLIAAITLLIYLVSLISRRNLIGAADYFIFTAAAFLVPTEHTGLFFIICGLIGVISHTVMKSNQIPFIPAIVISLLVELAIKLP